MMHHYKRGLPLFVLMVAGALAAYWLTPTHKFSEQAIKVELEKMIPTHFGVWRVDGSAPRQVVDPQQADMMARIYNQTLSRTYRNDAGYRIMLSIAYGDDQRDALQFHYPEVCYPAQGFQLLKRTKGSLLTNRGNIDVTRLTTMFGPRHEPVTYWATVGEEVVRGRLDKKLTEMKYGFRGVIPDGVLFRVSSIDEDTERAYSMQQSFVGTLLTVMDNQTRLRLSGT